MFSIAIASSKSKLNLHKTHTKARSLKQSQARVIVLDVLFTSNRLKHNKSQNRKSAAAEINFRLRSGKWTQHRYWNVVKRLYRKKKYDTRFLHLQSLVTYYPLLIKNSFMQTYSSYHSLSKHSTASIKLSQYYTVINDYQRHIKLLDNEDILHSLCIKMYQDFKFAIIEIF